MRPASSWSVALLLLASACGPRPASAPSGASPAPATAPSNLAPLPPPGPASGTQGSLPAPVDRAADRVADHGAAPGGDRYAQVEVRAERVSGDVYVLFGSGGNVGVCASDDGVVLVDDELAPLADKIKAALASVTDKPLRFVVDTHWHADHTGGNGVFGRIATVVAHENVRKRLAEGAPALELGGKTFDAIPKAADERLPAVTFTDGLTLHVGGEEIRAIHVERAHTDGDALVYFARANVVHAGDVFVRGFPFVDTRSGGSVRGLLAALKRLVHEIPPDAKVIPGHGKVGTMDDVRRTIAMIEDSRALVAAAVRNKQGLAEMKRAGLLAKYASFEWHLISTDAWLATLYDDATSPPEKAGAEKPGPAAPPSSPAPAKGAAPVAPSRAKGAPDRSRFR